MKEEVDCGLPAPGQPFSWAIRAGGVLYTTHGPVRADGSMATGPIEQQARLTLQNLQRAVQAAGGTMADVVQSQVYLIDAADSPAVDAVWREFFTPPWPNRATIIAAALVVPGMRLEVVAQAVVEAR
jgi:enamine deaminase RidA (YjgF/YER057c/UK114 family)